MKTNILLTLLIFISSGLYSQSVKTNKVNIDWGKEFKQKRTLYSGLVANDDMYYYALCAQYKGVMGRSDLKLSKFDKNLNYLKDVEIELERKGNKLDFEFIIEIKSQIYVFSTFQNNKTKTNYLFYQLLNKKTLKVEGEVKKVAEIDYSKNSRWNAGYFANRISLDSSKVLIYYNYPHDRKANEIFGFHVFDDKMNEIWNKRVILPKRDELFDVEDFQVDGQGRVHILGVEFADKRKSKRRGNPNYKYQLLTYTQDNAKADIFEIRPSQNFITDIKITINYDDELICGGFYSLRSSWTIKGSYFLKVDLESKEKLSENFKEFPFDLVTEGMKERKKKKAKKKKDKGKNIELSNYVLDDIILRDDGGTILVAEQFYITQTTYTNASGGTSTTTYYNYGNIIVVNISPEGNIDWSQKIIKHKKSSSNISPELSYYLAIMNGKLYFLFNSYENYEDASSGKVGRFKVGEEVVAMVEIDAAGNKTIEHLFKMDDMDRLILNCRATEQISNDELIIFTFYKKYHRLASVKMK